MTAREQLHALRLAASTLLACMTLDYDGKLQVWDRDGATEAARQVTAILKGGQP